MTRVDAGSLREQLDRFTAEKDAAVAAEDYEAAGALRDRIAQLQARLRHPSADNAAAETALEQVGLLCQAERPLSAMSGGEQQRVMIARAMAQETEHLLLDEPTNHLDIRYQHEVLSTVRQLRRTSIVVLHDLNLAAQYCDELVLLDHGRIAARGTPDEVLRAEVLEPVYRIGMRRWDDDGVHLAFGLR